MFEGANNIAASVLPAFAGARPEVNAMVGFAMGGEPISEDLLLLHAMDSDAAVDGFPSTTGNAFAAPLAIREQALKAGRLHVFQEADQNLRWVLDGVRDRSPSAMEKLLSDAGEIGQILSNPAFDSPTSIISALQIPTKTIVRYLLAKNGEHFALRASLDRYANLVEPGDIVLASGLMLREEGRFFKVGDHFRSTERRSFAPGEVRDEEWWDEKIGWVHFTLDPEFHQKRPDFESAYHRMQSLSANIGGIGFRRYLPMLHAESQLPLRLNPSEKSEETIRVMEQFGRYRISGPGSLQPHPLLDRPVLVDLIESEEVTMEFGDPPQPLRFKRNLPPKRYAMPRPHHFAVFELPDSSLMLLAREMYRSHSDPRDPFIKTSDEQNIAPFFRAGGVIFLSEEPGEFRLSLQRKKEGDTSPDGPSLEEVTFAFGALQQLGFPAGSLGLEKGRVVLVERSSLS